MLNHMVKSRTVALDATFSALSDPTRRAILERLSSGSSTVSELAAPFGVSLPAISKHLTVLENAGLLRRKKDGRVRNCTLIAGPMRAAAEWVELYRDFWEGKLDALGDFLEKQQKG